MWHKENVSEPSMCHAFSVLIHADYVSDEGALPCHLNIIRTHPYASYLSCRESLYVKQSHSGGGTFFGKIPWQHFPAEKKGHGALRL